MKQDKEAEQKLESVKKELNEKVEKIMGPPPKESGPSSTEAEAPAKLPPKPGQVNPTNINPKAKTKSAGASSPKGASNEQPLGPPKLPNSKPVEEDTPNKPDNSDAKPEEKPSDNNESQQTSDESGEDKTPYDNDPDLNKAVEDITKQDGERVLKAEDEAVQRAFEPQEKQGFFAKVGGFFKKWWINKWARWITILIVLLSVAGALAIPESRYYILNTFGVRSGASLRVVDASTQQPLRNVSVTIQDQTEKTNEDGVAKLSNLKLGETEITVERRAFAERTYTHTLGWGSNPLEDVSLDPTGIQYTFLVEDYLSEQPIKEAEAISEDASAFSDEDGKIVLTVDAHSDEDIEVYVEAEGYRTETLDMSEKSEEEVVKMVAERKHVFVSNRSGKFDIYTIDVDGQNEELILEGSGWERDDIVLIAHPREDIAAYVSTRENMRSPDGNLLYSLMILDLDSGELSVVERSQRIELLGWHNDKLVFINVSAGEDDEGRTQQTIYSYDYQSEDSTEIATEQYFNDVLLAKNKVYYAPSTAFSAEETEEDDEDEASNETNLYSVNTDGSAREPLLDREVWNIFRIDYDTLNFAAGRDWFEHKISTDNVDNLPSGPPNPRSRVYTTDLDDNKRLWVDNRDGEGVLLLEDGSDDENILVRQSGLQNPVRWLNDSTVVYRVETDDESADYAINIYGGDPQKLTNVTSTSGIERWYHY